MIQVQPDPTTDHADPQVSELKMFLPQLQRHLGVCSRRDLRLTAQIDRGFWNLISIRSPELVAVNRRGFLRMHEVLCDDFFKPEHALPAQDVTVPRREHLLGVFDFVDSLPGEPVLIHCQAGLSRSPAFALALIARALHRPGADPRELAKEAVALLLQIRPQAQPNPLIIELGFAEFMDPPGVRAATQTVLEHPTLRQNDQNFTL